MKAIVQSSYGAPEDVLALSEIEAPVPMDDEVLVRVRATSVNTPDWAAVTGEPYLLRGLTGLSRPKRPVRGTDVSGWVEAVGSAVTEFGLGDPVFGAGLQDARVGTFAELTAVPAHRLSLMPAPLGFEDAAACVMSGLTALDAVSVAEVGPGTRMLINGAAGGVGTFALQMAKRRGAEVTGVCSTRNVDFLRELGADHVVDYTKEDFTAGAARYQVVLDNVLNHSPSKTVSILAPKGIFVPNSLGNRGGWLSALPRMAHAALLVPPGNRRAHGTLHRHPREPRSAGEPDRRRPRGGHRPRGSPGGYRRGRGSHARTPRPREGGHRRCAEFA